jgi:hypothetical protein
MEITRFDLQRQATLNRIAQALEEIATSLKRLTEATAKTVVAKAATVPSNARFAPTDVIRVRVKGNPKHPNTGAWHLFNLYRDGMRVAGYVKAVRAQPHRQGAAYVALRWDADHGSITVGAVRANDEEEKKAG